MITCAILGLKKMWRLTKAKTKMKREHWTKKWNSSNYTKGARKASWTHGLIAQSVRAAERNSVVVGSNSHPGQLSIETSKNPLVVISYLSIYSATNVITCARLCLKQLWWLTKANTEIKREHWILSLRSSIPYRKLARVRFEPMTSFLRFYRAHALTNELSGPTMRCA